MAKWNGNGNGTEIEGRFTKRRLKGDEIGLGKAVGWLMEDMYDNQFKHIDYLISSND
jgi:hypothetical protein